MFLNDSFYDTAIIVSSMMKLQPFIQNRQLYEQTDKFINFFNHTQRKKLSLI